MIIFRGILDIVLLCKLIVISWIKQDQSCHSRRPSFFFQLSVKELVIPTVR